MGKKEITHEIVEHLGVLTKKGGGWAREVNIVSWNGADPKVDIRDWPEDHTQQPGKGITLTQEEALMAAELILNKCNY